MPKPKSQYVCQECGHASAKWLGQCPACTTWNSLVAEAQPERAARGADASSALIEAISLIDVPADTGVRQQTGIEEFDRIVGGGIVSGQVILVGGDPGIGKSTIMLQVAHKLGRADAAVLYVSGEESVTQSKIRAQRLSVDNPHILILAATDIHSILAEAMRKKPAVLMIDSIQVMYDEEISSAPGSVTQVRECAAQLVRFAKKENVAVVIVGHVTKTGAIAGPRVVEHLVDTVLYFEGERHNVYRILRAVKNRFGSTDEIGVFEMTGHGLTEVPNPSALFLAQRQHQRSGSAVGSALEGTRPLLLEVQALVATTPFGMPTRKTVGMDANRLIMLLAVLEKRVGIRVSTQDVFVNLAGGVKIGEPGLDLACIAAVASSFYDKPVMDDTVVMGEVGLGGEVRAVSQIERRVMEAKRLGFKACILPAHNLKAFREKGKAHLMWQGVRLVGCEDVQSALQDAGNVGLFRLIKRPFVKLQVLMPGETAAPNTPSGKSGTPNPQTVGVPFDVTVNAVDAVWNRVKSTDTITITSSDTAANLPADAALVGGTATFNITLNTVGSFTVTATDVSDGTKTANTSTATTVN